MDSVVIYKSVHRGNTKKIVDEICSVIGCQAMELHEVEDTDRYDLIGFASGIYYGGFHREIQDMVDCINGDGKKAFIVSTSGMPSFPVVHSFNRDMERRLKEAGFEFLGSFNCRGYDIYGPLRLIGGVHRGRPDKNDLKDARDFARGVLEHVV